ncbi:MAG: T9SS type A sorting domain-containing protein, partial [Chitinophagaceae bacterium]
VLEIIQANTLNLAGTVTGSGFIRGGLLSNLTVGGSGSNLGTLNFDATTPNTTNNIKDFTINRSGGSVTIGNALSINGVLLPTAGTLNTGNFITLRSTSIINTGIVGIVGGTINGLVTAERHFPKDINSGNGIRAYRDISPGLLPNSNIFTQWQEGGVNNNGYGTQITGQVGAVGQTDATTGMDYTASGAASLFSYNVNTSTGLPTWDNGIRNTKNNTASPFKGYRIAIRGNRANNLGANSTGLNAPATLRNTGTLITGEVIFTTSGVTANGSTNTNIQLARSTNADYTLVGNPYWSPLNWNSVANRNANISPTYWVWNPNIGTSGAYVTFNGISNTSNNNGAATNRYIQPGQAFFVQNVNTNPSFNILESDKGVDQNNHTAVFNENGGDIMHKLSFTLYRSINSAWANMDGAVMCYKNGFAAGKGREDAAKFDNASDNIAITNQNIYSIEGRPIPTTSDSIRLRLWNTTNNGNYQLQIDASSFNYDQVQPYLKDRFTNSQMLLQKSAMNVYNFTTTADTNSFNHRFTVIYTANNVNPLPIHFVQVKASAVRTGVHEIGFTTQSTDAKWYEVEYAKGNTNGQFTTIGKMNSKGDGVQTYSYTHTIANNATGIHYYRIRSMDAQGKEQYSSVVSVQAADMVSGQAIRVYPNPVVEKQIQLHVGASLSNQRLELVLYDVSGKAVFTTMLQHNNAGSNSSYRIALPTTMASGNYQLQVKGLSKEQWSIPIYVSTE